MRWVTLLWLATVVLAQENVTEEFLVVSEDIEAVLSEEPPVDLEPGPEEQVLSELPDETDITVPEIVIEDFSKKEASSNENVTKPFPKRVTCLPLNLTEEAQVQVLNGTHFLYTLVSKTNANVTNRTMPALCSLSFFYASWCPFSARAAASFNALARLYPDVEMVAVDTGSKYYSINTQFGVIALPSLILFHNSKSIAKYNLTEFDLKSFSSFISLYTSFEPQGPLEISHSDLLGPVPTKEVAEPDVYLYIAWIFSIICCLFFIAKSAFISKIVESIRNAWREAEMHEHQE